MNIKEIVENAAKPELYEKGTAEMWADEYISKQLLQVHLNPELDLASRKEGTINKTVEWILERAGNRESMNILDLGCGPGLYAQKFAAKGHKVTGVDFSGTSIEYARQQTKRNNSGITYIHSNYLELKPVKKSFDLVLMIYTDFGVLLPNERAILLSKIRKALKPGGIFIFDVISDKKLSERATPDKWEVAEKGFWQDEPYLALSRSFLFSDEKVILYQHIVINGKDEMVTYRFWTHHFSLEDLQQIIGSAGLINPEFSKNVLPPGDLWDGKNIIFCIAYNSE